jgi:hypothetical protein
VAQQGTEEDLHLVALDQLLGLREPRRRIARVVLDEQLDLPSRYLVIELLEAEPDPVDLAGADDGSATGQRAEGADLERGLRRCVGRREDQQRRQGREHEASSTHAWTSSSLSGLAPRLGPWCCPVKRRDDSDPAPGDARAP